MRLEPEIPHHLSTLEVASVLNVSRWKVARMARNGALPAIRVGKSLRFDPDDLRAWIKSAKEVNVR